MSSKACLFLCCLSTFLATARASTWSDIGREMASPVTTDAKYAVLGGGALTGLMVVTKTDWGGDDLEGDASARHPLGGNSKTFGRLGQLIPNILYAGGMYAHAKIADDADSRRRAILMTKATAYSSLVTTLLKYTVRERRPNHTSRNSFPSGHSTTAFAFASVIGMEHSLWWSIPAYTMAGLVAYSRLNDNMHYTQDVVAGATIGMSYGIGLALQQRAEKQGVQIPVVGLAPTGRGAMLAWVGAF